MIKQSNLSDMTIRGWNSRYSEIIKEFGYSKKLDFESALLLSLLLKKKATTKRLESMIKGRTVFVIGAGPSLLPSIAFLKKFKATVIAADSAIQPLIEHKIRMDIVVTDLDGDNDSLKKIGKTNSLVIVHAHGDNIASLPFVFNFKNCIGTTQTKPFGKIENFGGFTDGDRCVFLANHFKAKKIVLFGMDFGSKIGKYSKTKYSERKIKIKKLRKGKQLLEWLAPKTSTKLYTTSKPIKGFEKITYRDLKDIIIT